MRHPSLCPLQDAFHWEKKFSETLVKQQQFEPLLSSLQAGCTAEGLELLIVTRGFSKILVSSNYV